MRLKVLIFSTSFLPVAGGLEYELKWFLDNLDRRVQNQFSVKTHFVYTDKRSELYSQFTNIESHILPMNGSPPLGKGRILLRLERLIRNINPDIVHCHALIPAGVWVMLATRLMRKPPKIIVTSHGGDTFRLPRWSYGRRQTLLRKFLAKLTAKRLAANIMPSQAMTKYAIRIGVNKKKLIVIPNGVPQGNDYDFETDVPLISETVGSNVNSLRHNNGSGINFLSLSSGRPVKNLGTLVAAFSRAKACLGKSRLILASEGPTINELTTQIRESGLENDVTIIGKIVGLEKHYHFQNSSVYCNVSGFENFPVTLLEAMKHGTAILASNVGGIPEFIEHERNGLLVSPTDVSGIAEAMVRLYRDTNLRDSLITQAEEDVKRYSISRVIDEHLALYERLAS